jgi:hypothetical protein
MAVCNYCRKMFRDESLNAGTCSGSCNSAWLEERDAIERKIRLKALKDALEAVYRKGCSCCEPSNRIETLIKETCDG